jgi:hypothetical protein
MTSIHVNPLCYHVSPLSLIIRRFQNILQLGTEVVLFSRCFYHVIYVLKWAEGPLIHFKDEYNLEVATPVPDELRQGKHCKHTCSSHYCKYHLIETSTPGSVTDLLSTFAPLDRL